VLHNLCIDKEIPLTAEDERHRENVLNRLLQERQHQARPTAATRQQARQLRQRLADTF
jgi:hypothetical protein